MLDPRTYALDAALNVLKTSDSLVLCSQEPETFQEASVTYALCTFDIAPTNFTGPRNDGPAPGRRLFIFEKVSGQAICKKSGVASCFALLRVSTRRVLYVGSMRFVTLSRGDTCMVFDVSVGFDGVGRAAIVLAN